MQKNGFHDYITNEVFAQTPGISTRAMFGGWGLYLDGVIFGLIVQDQLYFKVGDSNRSEFEKLGSKPFTYRVKNNKTATMSYWQVPESVIDNKEQLNEWVEKSVAVSLNSRK